MLNVSTKHRCLIVFDDEFVVSSPSKLLIRRYLLVIRLTTGNLIPLAFQHRVYWSPDIYLFDVDCFNAILKTSATSQSIHQSSGTFLIRNGMALPNPSDETPPALTTAAQRDPDS